MPAAFANKYHDLIYDLTFYHLTFSRLCLLMCHTLSCTIVVHISRFWVLWIAEQSSY